MLNMNLTLQLQLLPDKEQANSLKSTIENFNAACNWLAEHAFNLQLANKVKLQQLFYSDLRSLFNLSAQMAIRCISEVVSAYKRDKSKRPQFRKHAAMPYDERFMSFKGIDRVSLLTLDGRVIVPFVMGKYQQQRFAHAKGQCDLVLRKDGKWFLLVTADIPEGSPIPNTDFIGVDFGVVTIATTSDGKQFSGADVEKVRNRYHTRRQTLQHAAARRKAKGRRPKRIRKALKRTKAKEASYRKQHNHEISKQLVEEATDTKRGIAIEELKDIRKRTRFRRSQRARMSGWSFHQLRTFIEYKATVKGVAVEKVDPGNTSRSCNKCGHCDKRNRKSQSEFVCVRCSHTSNADINAAQNIRARATVNWPMVSEHPQAIAA
jgi:putative transposase